jgi:hypothetical protein
MFTRQLTPGFEAIVTGLSLILAVVARVVLLTTRSPKIIPQPRSSRSKGCRKYLGPLAPGNHIHIPFCENVAHQESIVEPQIPVKQVPPITRTTFRLK